MGDTMGNSMDGITERTELFANMLRAAHGPSVTLYSSTFETIFSTSPDADTMQAELFISFMESDGPELSDVNKMCSISENYTGCPSVFANTLGMVWISEIIPKDGKIDGICLMGPVFTDDFSVTRISREMDEKMISVAMKRRFMEYIKSLPVIPLNQLYSQAVMLHYCLTGKQMEVSEFGFPELKEKKNREQFFTRKHGTYAAEQKILQLIEDGNLEYKDVFDRYSREGSMGHVYSEERIRPEKDVMIMFAVLCSRAAIRGGLLSETALTLCDRYVQGIEDAVELSTLSSIRREMFEDFIRRVYAVKNEEKNLSPPIRKACDYIRMYPEKAGDIHDMAQMLGYADYYFSTKFRRETGATFRDYVTQAKMEKAKVMLRESGMSISAIADSLGFGTQSHFGEVFREATGMSPGEYRKS